LLRTILAGGQQALSQLLVERPVRKDIFYSGANDHDFWVAHYVSHLSNA
jgi:hypothetical protein